VIFVCRRSAHLSQRNNPTVTLTLKIVNELTSDRILYNPVTLKIKTVNFQVLTRWKTLSSYTNSLAMVTEKAVALLKHEPDQDLELPALRLMGAKACDVGGEPTFYF
jgi:hypothetical protein